MSSACYQYFPVQDTAPLPPPGAEVRARLSPPQALDLGTVTFHDIGTVEGDVYHSQGDTLALFTRWIHTSYGYKHPANGAVFYFPHSQIGQLEQRRLVPAKTVVAAGVGVVALVAILELVRRGAGGSNPEDPEGGDVARIVVALPGGIRIRQ